MLAIHRFASSARAAALVASLTLVTACSDDDDSGATNEEEVITTVSLTFTPASGGAAITAAFDDPDGDGGAAPTVDPLHLAAGTTYAVAVRFQNKLETPPDEITDEIRDESDAHQVFFTGTAVAGPASSTANAPLTQSYSDADANGVPIGLANSFVASAGAGQLVVTLRHMPPVNGTRVKVAGLADKVRASGITALPGDTDAQVSFDVTVQ
jgi:hypothetical protein